MTNHQQLTRLVTEFQREGNLTMSAMKAGMDPKTARKYVKVGAVVCAARGPRTWRTRTDPLGAASALAEGYLNGSYRKGAKTQGHREEGFRLGRQPQSSSPTR